VAQLALLGWLQRAISSDVKIIGADLDAANGNSFRAARRCAIFGVVGGRIATGGGGPIMFTNFAKGDLASFRPFSILNVLKIHCS